MKKYCLVSDDSGHDYVIPSEHRSEWYDFDFEDYDFDLPDWARQVECGLEFENPTEDGKELFSSEELPIIQDLNDFNAFLIKQAESNVGFRFKVKQLKRVIEAITNH